MQDLQGINYLCNLLSIISNNPNNKEKYKEHSRTGAVFENAEKDALVRDWAYMAVSVISRPGEKDWQLLSRYKQITDDETGGFNDYVADIREQNDSKEKRTALSNAFNNILVNGRGARPYFFFGISMTIALASGNSNLYKDNHFYIGLEETKEILFKAMEVFDFSNVECVPDECFFDDESLQLLILTALYQSLKVVFPYKQQHRESNYKKGKELIEKVIGSSVHSELFSAIKSAAETENIIRIMWDAQDKSCNSDCEFPMNGLPFEKRYSIPKIENALGLRILDCDVNFRVRSFVEGKSGSGKSALTKAIVLSCRNRLGSGKSALALAAALGTDSRVFVPLLLECDSKISPDQSESDLIECAIDQMYFRARELCSAERNSQFTLEHYNDCKKFVLKYMQRKALRGELLLLVDGFSKSDKDSANIIRKKLEDICRYFPMLHVVVFSNRLKPSERKAFTGYNYFKINNQDIYPELIAKTEGVLHGAGVTFDTIIEDKTAQRFIDSPRRLIQYLNDFPGKSLTQIVEEEIEEEIEQKCAYSIDINVCKKLLVMIAFAALGKRINRSEKIIIPGNIVDLRFLAQIGIEQTEVKEAWDLIQNRRVLIEQAQNVNSYEFSNPLFFDNLLAKYIVDSLEYKSGAELAGILMVTLSKMSKKEFSQVIINIFAQVSNYGGGFNSAEISEESLSILIKTIAGIGLSYSSLDEKEYLLWAMNKILSDDRFKEKFVEHGKYENRRQMLFILERLLNVLASNLK